MSKFDIKVWGPGRNHSATYPSAAPRGLFLALNPAGVFELADGTNAVTGPLDNDVTVAGPTLGDAVYPGRIEGPYKAGLHVTTDAMPDEFVAEGPDLIDTTGGAGVAIEAGTALDTPISFDAGRPSIAQVGQTAYYLLVEFLTPEVAGELRARFKKIH